MSVLELLAAVGVVVLVIGRQLRGEPLRGKRLVLLPAILTVIGAVDLGRGGHHPTATDIGCIVVGALIAAGIGVAQGSVLRLEHRGGGLWGRMPVSGLWLWAGLVVSRLAMMGIAGSMGAHVAASTAPILLMLGINRLGQAAAVVPRSLASGIPLAPEKDGSVFLSGRLR
ncbi:hypothetical protein GA0115240_145827 [Streptomyces sp. DvalAA-14]|uniref:hypothetical protein n=1 Tax=unclassified Streptomyces TaxID=2593676 RepID=UPI00081B7D4F|nr:MULTISPECIES: hypothetical protein [unclassified Streptomyces]MYS22903.1 hypothetical protein [Streptomyces sp. SID4948]SCE24256.1 hypothetical protein GA0115240_145827 [Streptomyces sp. DvalAA-14]